MWTARVEADTGEILYPLIARGFTAGKGLLAFHSPLLLYCEHVAFEEDQPWFAKLDMHLKGKLCERAQSFLNSVIGGDWDYGDDEYEIFLARNGGSSVTETEFRDAVDRARNAWTSASLLISDLEAIIEGLKAGQLADPVWYELSYLIIRPFHENSYPKGASVKSEQTT